MNEETNKEEEKANIMEGLSITKVSDIIDSLIEKEDMKELKILKDRIIKFKEELVNKIKDKTIIEHESFKRNLFRNLETNLFYVIYIENPDVRKEKIRKTYLWFFDKLEKWNSLDKIKFRTEKNIDEKYKPEEIASNDIIIKDDEYELKEFHLHRTDIPGLEPPKQRLADYKTKQVKPPKRFKKDQTTMENLRFNINRFHGRVGSACNMVQLKSDNFYSKTGNLWYNPTNIPMNSDNTAIDVRKEIKSAYSINRPEYELAHLKIEKKIIEAKNIEMREKRSQEEIKKFMDEAAVAKAKYKEKREIKFNIDNIVKEYEKTFKSDKNAEQLIDEQIKIELNDKDSKINEFKSVNTSYKKPLVVPTSKIASLSIDDKVKGNKIFTGLNREKDSKIVELKKISSKYPNCFSNINNKVIYSKIENRNALLSRKQRELKTDNVNKGLTVQQNNNIKELISENQEKVIKLSLKSSKSELFDKIKKDQKDSLKIKYDTVAFNLVSDPILRSRIQSAKICDVKEIAPKKMDYVQYYIPLSAFDEINYKSYTGKFYKTRQKYNRPKTASEFAIRNYKQYENNYLALRRDMTKYYGQEKESMNKMLYEKIEQSAFNKEKEKEKKDEKQNKKALPNVGKGKSLGRVISAFNIQRDGLSINNTFEQMFDRPLEGPPRPMYYLPKPELSLLKKPPSILGKKKKKGKKKRRF